MTNSTVPPTPRDPYAPCDSNPFGVKPLGDELTQIENGFWTATGELGRIAATARDRKVARWALLGSALGNLLSWLPPYVVVADRDGSTNSVQTAGSLNFYVHMIAPSGKGKSRLLAAAEELIPPNVNRYGHTDRCVEPEPDKLGSGTGEGLCKHFVGLAHDPNLPPESKNAPKVMIQKTDVAVVAVDEVSTYVGELARTTSKSAGILTSLYSGQMTGSHTSGEDSRTRVPKHAARVIVQMLVQPELCWNLFTDALIAGGTPQRPLWLPAGVEFVSNPITAPINSFPPIKPPDLKAIHAMLPTSTPSASASYSLMHTMPWELGFPRAAASPTDLVWLRQSPQMAADVAAEDALREAQELSPAEWVALTHDQRESRKGLDLLTHTTFTRIKVSVALALLHGRLQPTDLDWQLAGVVMRVNLGMLAFLYEVGKVAQIDSQTRKGKERAVEHSAFLDKLDDQESAQVVALLSDVVSKVKGRPQSASALSRGLSTKRQKLLRTALDHGVDTGVLFREDSTSARYFPVINGFVYDATKPDGAYAA